MHGSYFETGHHVPDFLIKGFTISSISGFSGLCLGVFALTFFHEALRVFRQHFERILALSEPRPNQGYSLQSSPADEGGPSCINADSPRSSEHSFLVRMGSISPARLSRIKMHLLQSTLYVVQVLMAYIGMMVVMSYNVWLLVSVLVGAGLAHFSLGLTSLNANTLIAQPDSAHCDTGH